MVLIEAWEELKRDRSAVERVIADLPRSSAIGS